MKQDIFPELTYNSFGKFTVIIKGETVIEVGNETFIVKLVKLPKVKLVYSMPFKSAYQLLRTGLKLVLTSSNSNKTFDLSPLITTTSTVSFA